MSFRTALARTSSALQPEYARRDSVGAHAPRDPVFRFSIPVLRVRDVTRTVSWYQRHLGFNAEPFPDREPHEFAILERDGVQLLVRQTRDLSRRRMERHTGWDLYIWVDGLDLKRLQKSIAGTEIVRPLTPMGQTMAELELRDPDGYVLCIGGPTPADLTLA